MKKLTPADRFEGDNFGWSTSINKQYAIVGAISKRSKISNTLLQDVGAAYILKKDPSGKWKEIQKLEPDQVKEFTFFGQSVSISDGYAVVGADGEDDGENDPHSMIRKGAAYVYKCLPDGKWRKTQKMQLIKRETNDNFGYSVSIGNSFLAVSAPGKRNNENLSSGEVYIYKLQSSGGWKPFYTIKSPDKSYRRFGNTISLYDNRIAISNDSSVVCLYELKGDSVWQLNATFKATIPTDKMYGSSLKMYKMHLLIGAPGDFDPFENQERPPTDSIMQLMRETKKGRFEKIIVYNNKHIRDSLHITAREFRNKAVPVESQSSRTARLAGSGAVYVYQKNVNGDWVFQQRITPENRGLDEHFGNSVAISDSMIAVGAFGDKLDIDSTKNNYYAGAVYIFKLNKEGKWIQTRKLTANSRSDWDKFGFSLSAYQKTVIIGSRFEKEDAKEKNPLPAAGAVYLYEEK